jgi:hypothetical protein
MNRALLALLLFPSLLRGCADPKLPPLRIPARKGGLR